MLRNVLLSAVIGTLATFLPCFEWEGAILTQTVGALALSVDVFVLLFGTDTKRTS